MPTLHWIGKDKVINHHQDVPFRLLDHQYGALADGTQTTEPTGSGNRIIHGDNLEALKALLPEYEGQVKCIYIDPPYNTGNEGWVYNDNVNDPKIKKWLSQVVGKEGEDLSRHDKWLCMMYPRLKLLHKLLAEDGSIWISIDDVEYANLKLMCDEIFGAGNFVTNVIWQKNYSPKNSAKHFSVDHDSILVYARNADSWRPKLMSRSEEQNSRYKNPDNDPRGPWKSGDLSARNFYSLGTYAITTPSGRVIDGPPKGRYWVINEEKLWAYHKDNRIWWGKDGKSSPSIKRFLSDVQDGVVPQTLWFYTEVGHTQDAKKEANKILHDVDTFPTPKPTKLIERVLQLATDKDSIVLDSFAGSGTTAHAVLKLNQQDGGNRRFILTEMEDYAERITAERVKRVMQGYAGQPGTGGSFDYYTLGAPIFTEAGELNEQAGLAGLRQYLYYAETKQPLPAPSADDNAAFLGLHDDTAYYFHYQPDAVTTLNHEFLATMRTRAGQYIIYADNCLLPAEFMTQHGIIFKKIPRDISRF
ncbi:site-specific DNA-methyltransferase (plasmid) [Hymenobacter sp. NBH84]|uniref:site-specific DNA-methyltransferase n=1 Tax=Hymenobacter sp. NBH84 TaxID=2596915 RepID=UPI00162832FD|nr:site-specific DNA-methyltransferase [Hymenobacter sp. NBH84]QNE42071.1 site-specific DNA-methyltransferase [Hymenobacter sp. NBH84]